MKKIFIKNAKLLFIVILSILLFISFFSLNISNINESNKINNHYLNSEDIINVDSGEAGVINDPTEISYTDNGAEFSINLEDGTDDGLVTSFDLQLTNGSTINANEGAGLKIGDNHLVIKNLPLGGSTVVTITLKSKLSDVVKDIEFEPGTLGVIDSPTDIVSTDHGAEFSIKLNDGTLNGVVTSFGLDHTNGKINANEGAGLKIGDNHLVAYGLTSGE